MHADGMRLTDPTEGLAASLLWGVKLFSLARWFARTGRAIMMAGR